MRLGFFVFFFNVSCNWDSLYFCGLCFPPNFENVWLRFFKYVFLPLSSLLTPIIPILFCLNLLYSWIMSCSFLNIFCCCCSSRCLTLNNFSVMHHQHFLLQCLVSNSLYPEHFSFHLRYCSFCLYRFNFSVFFFFNIFKALKYFILPLVKNSVHKEYHYGNYFNFFFLLIPTSMSVLGQFTLISPHYGSYFTAVYMPDEYFSNASLNVLHLR